MELVEQISSDIRAAMAARDERRLGALRLIRAEILKAEKEKGVTPDDERVKVLLGTMLKQRRDSIEQFEKAGRQDLAEKERQEVAVIQRYLPAALTEDEMLSVVDAVLAEVDEPSPANLGKIMGQVMGKLKAGGRPFDAQFVNARVRQRLGAG